MVCFRYIIVNTLHVGDNSYNNMNGTTATTATTTTKTTKTTKMIATP
jgi:hypothetical protein